MATVVLRLAGGLGNQLFQYAAGLALAEARQARLLLDLSLLRRDRLRTYALDPFQLEPAFVSGPLAGLMGAFGRRCIGRAVKALLPILGWHYAFDRIQGYDPNAFAPQGSLILEGYWQSERYFAAVADKVRAAFTFREPPDPTNATFLERMVKAPAVAVHVRRGDYVSDPGVSAVHGACGRDYYAAAADLIRQRLPEAHYFVFSDDPDWAESNLTWPGPSEVVRHNLGRRDADDLRLMAACRHFIIANSSFSWWGAWLARHPDKIVVAPSRWFAGGPYRDADRTPPSWVRL